ncbi:MAG TPA: methionyl-tRNA formyltransferase [Patescibacteria group bacterium]|nr:methionyl-tRNA formyltransferase [Patescibacteria group bacterium]
MKNTSKTIIFFGSGPVAAESLNFLASRFDIEAVITKPQPAHHKQSFPVIDIANKYELTAHYPTSKQHLSQLFKEIKFTSPVGLVVDYGFIIGKDVIDSFSLGIVNSHFSLLPQWRGADPISFSILSGQAKTGVSLMVIEEGLDTGKLITQKVVKIEADDTTPSLTTKLTEVSNELLQNYLPKYITGDIKPHNQPHPSRATHSRKLIKADGLIDWHKTAQQIEREIRAFIDWPRSYTKLAGKEVIITKAHITDASGPVGKAVISGNSLVIYTGEQALAIDKLKPSGKPEMTAQAFLAGYKRLLV